MSHKHTSPSLVLSFFLYVSDSAQPFPCGSPRLFSSLLFPALNRVSCLQCQPLLPSSFSLSPRCALLRTFSRLRSSSAFIDSFDAPGSTDTSDGLGIPAGGGGGGGGILFLALASPRVTALVWLTLWTGAVECRDMGMASCREAAERQRDREKGRSRKESELRRSRDRVSLSCDRPTALPSPTAVRGSRTPPCSRWSLRPRRATASPARRH